MTDRDTISKKEVILTLAAAVIIAGGVLYFRTPTALAPTGPVASPANPVLHPTDGVLVEDTAAASSVPAGYRTLRDTELHATFNAPLDWKVQVLPEGDGRPSITSPDFANPLEAMAGAYIHCSVAPLPDQMKGHPEQFLALLQQGSNWTKTSLDGHDAYLSKPEHGRTMIISQLGANEFVMINFVDASGKYSSTFTEFLRSFHAL